MARRGITYGVRKQKPDGDFEESDRPVTGTGLLFMAYMADIANQFEFTQNVWANNPNFLTGTTGIDPVIGHGTNGPNQIGWTDACGAAAATANFDFKGFVKLLGGEYFFAPSLSFLTSL